MAIIIFEAIIQCWWLLFTNKFKHNLVFFSKIIGLVKIVNISGKSNILDIIILNKAKFLINIFNTKEDRSYTDIIYTWYELCQNKIVSRINQSL